MKTENELKLAIASVLDCKDEESNSELALKIYNAITQFKPSKQVAEDEILVPYPSDDFDCRDGKEIKMWMDGWLEGYKERFLQSWEYKDSFLEWRKRFFDNDINIQEWKTKSKGTRMTTKELHNRYKIAFLESPFKAE